MISLHTVKYISVESTPVHHRENMRITPLQVHAHIYAQSTLSAIDYIRHNTQKCMYNIDNSYIK